MATTQQLAPTVYDQDDDVMGGAGVTYETGNAAVGTVSSGGLVTAQGLGTSYIRVKSATHPSVFIDVPLVVTDESTPPDDSISLTSVENGLIRGVDFQSVTTGADVNAALVAAFGGSGAIIPAAGSWSVITDSTYGKMARLTAPVGDFGGYFQPNTGTPVVHKSVRMRVVARFNGWASEMATRRMIDIMGTDTSVAQFQFASSSVDTLQLLFTSSEVTHADASNTAAMTLLSSGALFEAILETIDNGDSTTTHSIYMHAVGSSRTARASFTTESSAYPTGGFQYVAFNLFSIFAAPTGGGTIDLRILESCDSYDGDDELIPIANLGS